MWYPYTLRMVIGGLASTTQACGLTLHAPSIRYCKWLASSDGKFRASGQQVNATRESSTVRGRVHR